MASALPVELIIQELKLLREEITSFRKDVTLLLNSQNLSEAPDLQDSMRESALNTDNERLKESPLDKTETRVTRKGSVPGCSLNTDHEILKELLSGKTEARVTRKGKRRNAAQTSTPLKRVKVESKDDGQTSSQDEEDEKSVQDVGNFSFKIEEMSFSKSGVEESNTPLGKPEKLAAEKQQFLEGLFGGLGGKILEENVTPTKKPVLPRIVTGSLNDEYNRLRNIAKSKSPRKKK